MKVKAKSFEIHDSKTLDHLSILSETFETPPIFDFYKKKDLETTLGAVSFSDPSQSFSIFK